MGTKENRTSGNQELGGIIKKLFETNQEALAETDPVKRKPLLVKRREKEKELKRQFPGLQIKIGKNRFRWWFDVRTPKEKNRELPKWKEISRNLRRYVRFKPDASILKQIESLTQGRKPVQLVIGYGCVKNQNVTSRFLPDLAEEKALGAFVEMAEAMKKINPAGLQVKIITSGKRAELVNYVSPEKTTAYHSALQKLILQKGWQDVIEIIPIGDLYLARGQEFQRALVEARSEIEQEWNKPVLAKFWQMEIEHARRNICRDGLEPEVIKAISERSAFNYQVFRRAEQKVRLIEERFPEAIKASYNIGHKDTLVLWTLEPGNITQPWQGEGVVADDGKVLVITQERKKRAL